MKLIIKPLFLAFFLTLSLLACNNEELFVEPTAAVVDPTTPEDTTTPNDSNPVVPTTTPCDFKLDAVQANSTVIINCVMDLQGKTINLPANVTIVYEGGDIINGTLNFSNNSVISGELMNTSLTMSGSKPQLKDPTFTFDPKRWGIVEGETTSAIAQNNNNILEKAMFDVKKLGISTFKIDKMDAYFEVSKVTSTTTNRNFYFWVEGINIPSDFNLVMTDKTILRVYPTVGTFTGTLLVISESSNVTVSGGVLYGDRDLRAYSKANAEEGAHLLSIRSGQNVVIDGVKMTMGSIGGLNINSFGFSFNPDYKPTNKIIVKNCIFDKNRMIAFAITDGYNILVENNTFIDTANPTQKSDGGVVGYAMDLEPVRDRDTSGNLRYYQKVYDVTIRGNTERGSRIGAFTIYAGDNIIIENNDLENLVSWSYASNSKVRNNAFKALSKINKPAILVGGSGETVFNNEVSGNTITGYDSGITVYFGKVKIFNNIINNCTTGIFLNQIIDTDMYNNKILSNLDNSSGIKFQLASGNNISIKNNEVNVKTRNINFVGLNQKNGEENFSVTVEGNSFISTGILDFYKSKGVIFTGNTTAGRIQIEDVSNIKFSNNTINSGDGNAITARGMNSNVTINNNTITRPSKFECISALTSVGITESANSCN